MTKDAQIAVQQADPPAVGQLSSLILLVVFVWAIQRLQRCLAMTTAFVL